MNKHSISRILVISAFLILACWMLTSCSTKKNDIVGTWKVVSGRSLHSIFEFTADNDLYVYRPIGQTGQAFWYGWQMIKEKKRSANLRQTDDRRDSLELAEQGIYEMKGKNKIKFWSQVKSPNGDVMNTDGPVYEIIERTSTGMKIKEWQSEVLDSGKFQLKEIGEMTLVPVSAPDKE